MIKKEEWIDTQHVPEKTTGSHIATWYVSHAVAMWRTAVPGTSLVG